LAPSIAFAQLGWGQPGYNEGYDRGQRAGVEDSRRGNTFEFRDESDYRRGDLGYRSPFGNRDRYRDSFRLGFQDGYRSGFGVRPGAPGRGGFPPWLDGRGRGYGRYDLAYQTGLNDGYEAGLDDARDRRRYDPISERRFRNGDRGYQRQYGPRELYENNYRAAFKLGYERGYADGRRYGGRPGGGGFFGFGFRF
jgi:hypothetical protein